MKNRILTLLVVLLSASTILFAVLWQAAAHDSSDLRLMAVSEAGEAYEHFTEFSKSEDETDFICGLSALRAFSTAYTLLTEGTVRYPDHAMLNELCGTLLSSPETAEEHIGELTDITGLLSEDIEDITALSRLSELLKTLTH